MSAPQDPEAPEPEDLEHLEHGYTDEDPAGAEYDEADEALPEISYMAAVRVWAAAAWADGVVVPEEALAMARIIQELPLTDEERITARGWVDTRVELEDGEVAAWPYPIRVAVFRAAVEMVACDDEVVEAEQSFLSRLQVALNVAEDEATMALASLAKS